MARENYNDLLAFLVVARERSFTRAAAQLGVSQSALSHTVRSLEARLGLRLLARTTRSVSPTEAGERLVQTLEPRLQEIDSELAALSALRDTPAGNIRITAAEHSASTILWPRLKHLSKDYPDIKIEIVVDYALTDIVEQRFDAGVRLGDQVARDMIAVRISPDQRMAVVGSPSYFTGRSRPQSPQQLAEHQCINLRLATHGGLYAWEFERDGHKLNVRVEGQWIFNSSVPMLRAALAGVGLAYLPEDMVEPHLADGSLKQVLKSWCPTFPGYYLYYPSRRQPSPAFMLVLEALRYREPAAS
ncbi:DNA-binding transcriptional LysR family regulator [Herbaspirillum sp. Sphag1AN]|uniref:LysR family transcriptional regulator n=1 Tax=unclassified Herbaspirillum TaxID=2624150 RepID=UPI0016150D49|nr:MULTISPECIES: LysR family transcriptional regulator [unclassified Herbaspirillum]MBB3212214.1 DNA-binding transcriptional LysR family regulator [Herbaspirillum sp. Sphag1AN]MBB3245688.1 DNA-binding transcriptional LysR family regulator [Herbaspirillum sp. Sphag64]